MILWKILYSPYDIGAYVIMVVGLALNAIADLRRPRSGGR